MRMTRLDGRHANAEVMTVLSVFLGDEITLHGHKVWLGLPEVYQTKAHKALQAAAASPSLWANRWGREGSVTAERGRPGSCE